MNAEKFWSRVDASAGADRCWPWLGPVTSGGYGVLRWNGRQRTAHSVALELTAGESPSRREACHHPATCTQRRTCCNPGHLYWGTRRQNLMDKSPEARAASHAGMMAATTPEQRSAWAKKANAAAIATTTPEWRSARSRKAAAGFMLATTSEQRSANGRKAGMASSASSTAEERIERAKRASAAYVASRTPEEHRERALLMRDARRRKKAQAESSSSSELEK